MGVVLLEEGPSVTVEFLPATCYLKDLSYEHESVGYLIVKVSCVQCT